MLSFTLTWPCLALPCRDQHLAQRKKRVHALGSCLSLSTCRSNCHRAEFDTQTMRFPQLLGLACTRHTPSHCKQHFCIHNSSSPPYQRTLTAHTKHDHKVQYMLQRHSFAWHRDFRESATLAFAIIKMDLTRVSDLMRNG